MSDETDDVYREFLRVRAKNRDAIRKYAEEQLEKTQMEKLLQEEKEEEEEKYPYGHVGYGATGFGGAHSGFPYQFPYQLS